MSFLPKTRTGLIVRAFIAAILVVGFAAGATATTGLLQVKNLANILVPGSQSINVTLPKPGKPETLLLIGSDHRSGSSDYTGSNTDTMLLIRMDDNSSTINLMSVPRDLEVTGPGGVPVKLNSIYSTEGGPNGLLKVLRQQVFPGLQVNHVIDTNFTGFSDLIDAIGCVYTDVDHRYYNATQPAPSQYNYSSIDIQPGYQKLCGGVHNANGYGALAFVRFRHTDSDEVRNARQQDFLRWAKDGYSTSDLLNNEGRLLKIFANHTTVDKSLASSTGLLDLFTLVLDANKLSLRTIPFPEYFGACGTDSQTPCYVYPCPDLSTCSGYGGPNPTIGQPTQATEATYKEFVTPTHTSGTHKTSSGLTSTVTKPKRVKEKINTFGLDADPGDGRSQAGQLEAKGNVGIPIYYPQYIKPSPTYGLSETYCYSITDDCNRGYEPESAFVGSYPRRYKIAGPGGRPENSYVMTLQLTPAIGEYYTVQGTSWLNPPILNHPSKVVHINGHELYEYDDGSKISLVATRTPKAVYWITNTLDNAIPNGQMINMAASLTRYK